MMMWKLKHFYMIKDGMQNILKTERRKSIIGVYCGTGSPIDITKLTAVEHYAMETGTGYEGVSREYFEECQNQKRDLNRLNEK